MIVTTLDHVAGHAVGDTLGLARGAATWSRRTLKTHMGGIRQLATQGTTELDEGLDKARARAMAAIEEAAARAGANAVVGLQTEMKELSTGTYMVSVMGTAVSLYRLPNAVPAIEPAGESSDGEMGLVATLAQRPSFEGSMLRH